MSTRITGFCIRRSTCFPVSLARSKSTAASQASVASKPSAPASIWTETSLREKALAAVRTQRINELLEAQALDLTHSTTPVRIQKEPRIVTIEWADGHESRFHATWLRANCSSNFHHPTGQRIVFPGDISPDLKVSDVTLSPGSSGDETRVSVRWSNDSSPGGSGCSTFETAWLRRHCYSPMATTAGSSDLSPQSPEAEKLATSPRVPEIHFDEIMSGDEGLLRWLEGLEESGLCLLRGVPTREGMVKEVAELVAPVSHGFLYDSTFDVYSKDDPVNIAYTPLGLGLHMDLSYYESPPGIQMLHCMRFDQSVNGGNSTFMDVHVVANLLKEQDPESFATLSRVPCTFQKDHMSRSSPVIMKYKRPHISVNGKGEVIAAFWSPQFEGPLEVPPEDVEPYYAAYRAFQALLNSEQVQKAHLIEMRLQEGDLISFNQRRMLHGRGQYSAGPSDGVRHLQGTYLNIDEYLCRLRVLQRHTTSSGTITSGMTFLGNASH